MIYVYYKHHYSEDVEVTITNSTIPWLEENKRFDAIVFDDLLSALTYAKAQVILFWNIKHPTRDHWHTLRLSQSIGSTVSDILDKVERIDVVDDYQLGPSPEGLEKF